MIYKKIVIATVVIIVVGIMLVLSYPYITEEIDSRQLVGQCKKLEVGMEYSQLIEIMGEPGNMFEFEEDGKIKKQVIFPSPRFVSTFTQCVIDKQTNLVEEIICGEGYRLKN